MSGNRVGVVRTDGSAYFQDAPFSCCAWKIIANTVRQMVMSGNRVGVVRTDGSAYFQDAPFSCCGWKIIDNNDKQMVMNPP